MVQSVIKSVKLQMQPWSCGKKIFKKVSSTQMASHLNKYKTIIDYVTLSLSHLLLNFFFKIHCSVFSCATVYYSDLNSVVKDLL